MPLGSPHISPHPPPRVTPPFLGPPCVLQDLPDPFPGSFVLPAVNPTPPWSPPNPSCGAPSLLVSPPKPPLGPPQNLYGPPECFILPGVPQVPPQGPPNPGSGSPLPLTSHQIPPRLHLHLSCPPKPFLSITPSASEPPKASSKTPVLCHNLQDPPSPSPGTPHPPGIPLKSFNQVSP